MSTLDQERSCFLVCFFATTAAIFFCLALCLVCACAPSWHAHIKLLSWLNFTQAIWELQQTYGAPEGGIFDMKEKSTVLNKVVIPALSCHFDVLCWAQN